MDIHPLVFQSHKTLWVLLTSLLVVPFAPVRLSPWGIVSGLFWVPAGVAAVVSVKHVGTPAPRRLHCAVDAHADEHRAGLGVGQGVWSSLIVLVSFTWGAVVFQEPLQSVVGSLASVVALAAGIFGMAVIAAPQQTSTPRAANAKYLQLAVQRDGTEAVDMEGSCDDGAGGAPAASGVYAEASVVTTRAVPPCGLSHRAFGLLAAVFNGVWGGSNMVPLKLVGGGDSPPAGIEYVFSFAFGSALVTAVMWMALVAARKLRGEPLPVLHSRVMLVPGMIAGCLWSIGNFCAIVAVLSLGEGIGYSAVQSSIIVSGLWGLFWYREVAGRRRRGMWLAAALLATGGLVGLSQQLG